VLRECGKNGLTYSPTKNPDSDNKQGKHHRICFPFAIVEIKHGGVNKSEKRKVVCQAANASSTALAMLCELNRYNLYSKCWHGRHNGILPVASFTFVGSNVWLWLSYVSSYDCGDLKARGGNLHQAQRDIKNGPRLSAVVSQRKMIHHYVSFYYSLMLSKLTKMLGNATDLER
jgi:hypothetical protein